MDKLDNFISPIATPEQAKEIARRHDSGQVGTICPPKAIRDSYNCRQGRDRFRWIKLFMHALRHSYD